MVIYRELPDVIINQKIWHIHKHGQREHRGYTMCEGDIPVSRINETTKGIEDVVNPRGNAYAYRNARRYRRVCRNVEY